MARFDPALRTRLVWVLHFEETLDAGHTCARCEISRPPLRLGWNRYKEQGKEGLRSRSKARHKPPEKKLTSEQAT